MHNQQMTPEMAQMMMQMARMRGMGQGMGQGFGGFTPQLPPHARGGLGGLGGFGGNPFAAMGVTPGPDLAAMARQGGLGSMVGRGSQQQPMRPMTQRQAMPQQMPQQMPVQAQKAMGGGFGNMGGFGRPQY